MSKSIPTAQGLSSPFTLRQAIIVLSIIVTLLVASQAWLSWGTARVAYVKLGPLLEKYQGMIDARADYQRISFAWRANVDTLANELQNRIKAYEKDRARMSPKERQLSEELLRNKQQQFIQYRDATQSKAQEEDRKMTESVLQKVNTYVEKYGKRSRYHIILGANSSGNIMYAAEALDITEEITKGLNEEYGETKGKPSATDTTSVPKR